MLHQQAVDEDVPATDAAEKNEVGAVIEKGNEFPGDAIILCEREPQGVMVNNRKPSELNPEN